MIGTLRYPGAGWGVALALLVSLAWMPAPYAWSDKGHGHAKKKQSTLSKATAPEKAEPHGNAEGTKPHEDAGEVKPRGIPGMGTRDMPGMGMRGMPGMPGHGQEKPPGDIGREKALSPLATRGKQLVKDLHCNACHVRIEEEGHVHAHAMPAPDITFLGDKLRADWLYAFLKNPHTLRPWLKVRMPNFRLTDREALALTKHIVRDMRDHRLRPLLAALRYRPDRAPKMVETGKKWVAELECAQCHPGSGKKPPGGAEEGDLAPSLDEAARRLNPDWMTRFLRNPQSIYPGTKMPNFFFEDGDPLMEGAKEMMLSIRDYLMSRVSGRSRAYYKALRRYPNVTAAEGYRLMDELNCAGCHNVRGFHRTLKVGPILRYEGSKVREPWLNGFLRRPYTIRPDGYRLGSKARMPNFRVAELEVQAISAYLMTLKDEGPNPIRPTADSNVVARGKALFDRMACSSCHTMNGHKPPATTRGFRGPNLSRVATRLQGAHLVKWLSDPKMEDAHPIVPNFRLTDGQLQALVSYLMTMR